MDEQKRKEPATPLDASTVILVRDSHRGQYELFLMRRHKGQSFMGGAFVFPGGRLDKSDCDPELAAFARGPSAGEAKRLLQARDIPEGKALGLFFSAVRETFEEAGVLLAYDPSGRLLDFHEGETAGRFAPYRLELHGKKLTLKDLAEKEHLTFALDLLTPFSHWITPAVESKRFTARFFLARLPGGQLPFHDTLEMTKSLWISPSAALERHNAGQILLMPPTLKTVVELNQFSTIEELFASAAARRIYPILPQPFSDKEGFGVKLPHDPEYTIMEYKQPPLSDDPSRIIMRDGVWKVVKFDNTP